MKRQRTPQEKKVLSYTNDGRNTFGESRAISRKAIAKRKAKANRALRRAASAIVPTAQNLEELDTFVPRTGRRSWRKVPDAPLAEYVGRTLGRRKSSGMNAAPKASALLKKAKAVAVKRGTTFKGPLQNDNDG